MTVGRKVSELSGLPLFHNHLSIEAVLPVFEFGTKAFNRVVTSFRENMIREVLSSDLPGLIFTYVWAFGEPGDSDYVRDFKELVEKGGGRLVFAELQADLETRLERNADPERLLEKRSKRDVDASRRRLLEAEERYQLNSGGDFPYEDHLLIDNTHLPPEDVASQIVEHFSLPRKHAL